MNEIEKYHEKKALAERIEHRDVLLAIASIMKTKEGSQLFKYLFKSFDVMNLPPREMEGNNLHEYLGFLRAGNSLYKLSCEADYQTTANLIAEIERRRYDDEYELYRIENGLNGNNNED